MKSREAFRTISEVANELDVPQHVLRFWETRFSQVRPMKRGGNRRYYRPADVELLRAICHLLYTDGYTIKGVQKLFREKGVRKTVDEILDGAAKPAVEPGQKVEKVEDASSDAAPPAGTPAKAEAMAEADGPAEDELGAIIGELKALRSLLRSEDQTPFDKLRRLRANGLPLRKKCSARNPIGAAARAGDDVIGPLDRYVRSQDGSKKLQFRGADAAASLCRLADRAVVLNEQKAAGFVRVRFRHIALGAADFGQGVDSILQVSRIGHARRIVGNLPLRPHLEQRLHGTFAEGGLHIADQIIGEIPMPVWKLRVSGFGKVPVFARPAASACLLRGGDELLLRQRIEMLTNGHGGDPYGLRQLARGLRSAKLQPFEDGAPCLDVR